MAYAASVVLDSISEAGVRLTTMEVTFPRMVLSEFNTHRVFSRNSASSRAIPFVKQLERITHDPVIPVHWGKNQPGMQADEELEPELREQAEHNWLIARDYAVLQAQALHQTGVHKQVVNRLLEPFMWQTVIVTATEWSNFFALRANPDAQPEIRVIAEMIRELYWEHQPTSLAPGQWHLPLIQSDEIGWALENIELAKQVSAARCARVSYLTHDGRRDVAADLTLHDRLVSSGHMSPLEHVATPCPHACCDRDVTTSSDQGQWHGNFRGWKQLRKFIPGEHDFTLMG